MTTLNILRCIILHVACNAAKTKDLLALLHLLESEVDIINVSCKNCKIMKNEEVWCIV